MSISTSRSNSWSSVSSSSSSLAPARSRYSPYNLELRAIEILTSVANSPPSTKRVTQHISPHIKVEHDDNGPVYSLQKFLSRYSDASSRSPNFRLDVKEACVDEVQRKVWVRSEITGLRDGVVKESVDMLYFDDQGILIRSVDYQKVKRRH